MLKCYVGSKIIKAEPAARSDIPGYDVHYPDGYKSWSPKETFEIAYREITPHERQLIEMTDAEASVAAISDGGERDKCTHVSGKHQWEVSTHQPEAWDCVHCGAERFTDPNAPGG